MKNIERGRHILVILIPLPHKLFQNNLNSFPPKIWSPAVIIPLFYTEDKDNVNDYRGSSCSTREKSGTGIQCPTLQIDSRECLFCVSPLTDLHTTRSFTQSACIANFLHLHLHARGSMILVPYL